MVRFQDVVTQHQQDLEKKVKDWSAFAQMVQPIPIRPRNIDFFGRLPYLPEPYTPLLEGVDHDMNKIHESAAIKRKAGYLARTQLGLRPHEPRPYSTTVSPPASPNGVLPLIEETRAHIIGVVA